MKSTSNGIKSVTANKSARTFTIRKEDGTKYRTCRMSKEEFNSCENNTLNDWSYFLQTDMSYSRV
jgi:hypothetical protein